MTRLLSVVLLLVVALFVVTPDTTTAYNFLAAVMFQQCFQILVDIADHRPDYKLPRHLRFLPRSQFGVQLFGLLFDFFLQARDFFGDINAVLRRRQAAQAFDLAFQFGNRFFKFQKLFLFQQWKEKTSTDTMELLTAQELNTTIKTENCL